MSLAYSPNHCKRELITSTQMQSLCIRDNRGHTGPVMSLAYHPNPTSRENRRRRQQQRQQLKSTSNKHKRGAGGGGGGGGGGDAAALLHCMVSGSADGSLRFWQ
jgi:hypothetical protein